jgi:molybdopterin molybdotransferase
LNEDDGGARLELPAEGPRPGTLVFGLPGNPVSGLVGYLLLVRPALAVLAHRPGTTAGPRPARLTRPFRHRGDRPTYHPARQVAGPAPVGERLEVETLDWAGSADLRTVASADGFAAFPPGDRDYAVGEIVDFLPMR